VSELVAQTWDRTCERLRRDLTDFAFQIWIEPLEPLELDGTTLRLRAPDHIRSWVRERYLPLLRAAARDAIAPDAAVELVDHAAGAAAGARRARGAVEAPAADEDERLNPKYTFEQFVIGGGNRFAHAAALAVAELPAQAYNPLFIHGAPGLGKTHLLHAIGNYVRRYGGGLKVRYTTIETFTSQFVGTLRRNGDLAAFKERFRSIDVLLVDDVQFVADKGRTKEEFFHTFNALYETGSQLVLTSDRQPADLPGLEDRLAERFASGLVAEVEPPEHCVRLAILRQRAHHDGVDDVPQETLEEIARRVAGSVRMLEGALIRVVAYASLRGVASGAITADLAREVLAKLYPSAPERCSLADIQAAAARSFGLTPDALLAYDRRPQVALARQIAMYLARELTDETLPAIGAGFGGRNHTTILHAHRRIAQAMRDDQATSEAVDAVRRELARTRVDRSK
jgi:chromosomal replication initiator protein